LYRTIKLLTKSNGDIWSDIYYAFSYMGDIKEAIVDQIIAMFLVICVI
jgi:hypothetical protein